MRNFSVLPAIIFSLSLIFTPPSFAQEWAGECRPTMSDVEGPFFLPDTPFRELLAPPDEPGRWIKVEGRVLSGDCKTPLKDVLIEVWHTDSAGKYKGKDEGALYRGRLKSGDDGSYSFMTIMPGRYRLGNSYRPAHIHFRLSSAGHRTLITQLYFRGDPYLAPNDPCGPGCRSDDALRIMKLEKVSPHPVGKFLIVLERLEKSGQQ